MHDMTFYWFHKCLHAAQRGCPSATESVFLESAATSAEVFAVLVRAAVFTHAHSMIICSYVFWFAGSAAFVSKESAPSRCRVGLHHVLVSRRVHHVKQGAFLVAVCQHPVCVIACSQCNHVCLQDLSARADILFRLGARMRQLSFDLCLPFVVVNQVHISHA